MWVHWQENNVIASVGGSEKCVVGSRCFIAAAYTISHDSKFYRLLKNDDKWKSHEKNAERVAVSRFKDEGDTREQSPVIHENVKHEEDRTEDREER